MKILVTTRANESSGSWQIRGIQLGNAIGADIIPKASKEVQRQYDRVIHVKRYADVAEGAILDIVDAWPQPAGNAWSFGQLRTWAQRYTEPFADVIAATHWMQKDLQTSFFLRHHYRPNIKQNQIRQKVRAIGYEGSPRYLDGWLDAILNECSRRGWAFLTNPVDLAQCDIVLAVRGEQWRGYATDHWKSCVKMANAVGSNTPIIALEEKGYDEMMAPFYPVKNPDDLAGAFDSLEPFDVRSTIAEMQKGMRHYWSLETVAGEYLEWLRMKS